MNYAKLYASIMSRAAIRGTDIAGYFERHHIVPRALGGSDEKSNIALLSAREHFLAHWLLFKLHGCAATARAYKLMLNDQGRRRGRDYEVARKKMSESMCGENNVAKRPEVRELLKANASTPFLGVSRPEHAALLKQRKHWAKENNYMYGRGEEQRGAKNKSAVPVIGTHPTFGRKEFCTQTEAAQHLGVSQAAIFQALAKKQRSKGWTFERA